jgi:hypothetical protein
MIECGQENDLSKNRNEENMKMAKFELAIMAATLAGTLSASASYLSDFTVGPGHSWDVSWTDTSSGVPINGLEALVVAGGATFDAPVIVGLPGWNGTLLNSTLTYASGPADGSDRTISLSFTDPPPLGGVVVDIFELYNGAVLPGQAWQWYDLPSGPPDSDWGLISSNALVPVPEPTTIISGVLMLLPFGASTLRILRRNRAA